MLSVRILLSRGVLDTTLRDKVSQRLTTGQCFSPGSPVSSTYNTDCHDLTEILWKVASNTITTPPPDAVMKGYLYHTSSLVSLHTKTGACDIHSYLP